MRMLGILALAGVLAAPIAWKFALKDYQKARILDVHRPVAGHARAPGTSRFRRGITVGSGGLWEKGFMKGTQGQLRFLPVAHNDFIFSVLGGGTGVRRRDRRALGLYLLSSRDRSRRPGWRRIASGRSSCWASLASFTFQVFYNITMSAGLAPVKGLTLPLMSYGGSSLIATLTAFGLILNVRMRRFTN